MDEDDDTILQQRRRPAQGRGYEIADIDRLAVGNDHAGIEPGHVEKVADEAIEPLRLAQRRAQEFVARRLVIALAMALAGSTARR